MWNKVTEIIFYSINGENLEQWCTCSEWSYKVPPRALTTHPGSHRWTGKELQASLASKVNVHDFTTERHWARMASWERWKCIILNQKKLPDDPKGLSGNILWTDKTKVELLFWCKANTAFYNNSISSSSETLQFDWIKTIPQRVAQNPPHFQVVKNNLILVIPWMVQPVIQCRGAITFSHWWYTLVFILY